MSTKSTLLLLAIAGALLGFIALYEMKLPKSWQIANQEKYVLVFDRNSVEGIDISSNEDKVELRKCGNQWVMNSPVKDRADVNAVNEILSLAEALQREPIAGCANADKKQMKAFGVAKPAVRLKLLGKEMPPELLFGKDTAVEGKIYVRLDGSNTVSAANNELRNLIVRKPDEFRDRKLAYFNSTGVSKVSVKTAAGEIDLAKEAGRWAVTKPLKARADDVTVNAFLNSVLNTKINEFLPANSANLNSYGLSEPRGTATFQVLGSDQPTVLEIGARDEKTGGIYARISDRGSVCLLPKETENILGLQPNDLRDRRLMRVDLDIVDRITLRPAGKPPVLLQRNLENWVLREDDNALKPSIPANKSKILQCVKELQTQKITAFVTDVASDLAKYGFDQPQLRVTFSSYASQNTAETNAGEQPVLTLAFGKTEDDIVYARVEHEPFIVSIDKAFLDSISTNPVEWRSLLVKNFKPTEIVGFQVTSFNDKGIPRPPVALVMKFNDWAPDEGSFPGTLNRINIRSFVNTLASLKAMHWTNEPDIPSPSEIIEFTTGPGKTYKLILGPLAPDQSCLALFKGTPGVFRLSAPDVSALRLQLVDPLTL